MDKRLRVAYVSIGANIVLVALKLFGAQLSNSFALKADAIHSLSDVFVSLLVLFGILFAKNHPRWLKTVENAVALVISSLIMGAAVALFVRSLQYREYTLENIPWVIGIVWVCILISYAVARYKIRVGRECDSPSLQADGFHSMMDMYSSVAVLVGLVTTLIGFRLDTVACIVVALLIFKIGLEVMVGAIQGMEKSEVLTFETVAYLRGTTWGGRVAGIFDGFARVLPSGSPARLSALAQRLWARRRSLVACAIVAALAAYALSGFYVIQPDEVGVLLRFGRLASPEDGGIAPGLHYRLPSPMSMLHRVKLQSIRQLEFGFRNVSRPVAPGESTGYLWESRHSFGIYEKRDSESIMITGDKNEVDLNVAIEYRIAEGSAAPYLFRVADSEALIRGVTESCIRQIVGCMALEEVLTTARGAIESHIRNDVQEMLDSYGAGVTITTVLLQDVHPPISVVPAFRQVATARENRATMINQALAEQKEVVPHAEGLADFMMADAEAHKAEQEMNASGDATYFEALAAAFREDPAAVSFVMYMNSIEDVLPEMPKVVFDREVQKQAQQNGLQTFFFAGEFLKRALGEFGMAPTFEQPVPLAPEEVSPRGEQTN